MTLSVESETREAPEILEVPGRVEKQRQRLPIIARAAIVVPVFNHAGTLRAVVEGVRMAVGRETPLIVVDDGSSDSSAATLESMKDIVLLRHEKNRGKGEALRTGMLHAAELGCTHAITVDADGQHAPADVARVLHEARPHPESLILGQRDLDGKSVPAASRRGRDLSAFWLRVETGLRIADTQCGLRAYPLEATLALPQHFGRYDWETEILARMAWAGIGIRSVPIECIYFANGRRVTHFRPVVDTLRGVRVNVFLVLRRLAPVPFKQLGPHAAPVAVRLGRWWKWATWKQAAGEAIRAGSSNAELALAFSLGVFVGLTPLYLLQTILAIYFSRRLHLNVLAAVIGSHVSLPPLAPIWLAADYMVGRRFITGGGWGANLGAFLLGNVVVAAVMAVVALLLARGALALVRRPRPASMPEPAAIAGVVAADRPVEAAAA